MNHIKIPFPRSWWVEPERILAGCYPGDIVSQVADEKLQALLKIGIRNILCLQEENELGRNGQPFVGYFDRLRKFAKTQNVDITWQRFPIRDGDVPSTQLMQEILQSIELAMHANFPTYIHCWGGHGRTGTVVGCWLVNQGITGEQALTKIAQLRQFDPYLHRMLSPHTEEQCQMVLDWKL